VCDLVPGGGQLSDLRVDVVTKFGNLPVQDRAITGCLGASSRAGQDLVDERSWESELQ
jgi:hypothetical protein